MKPFPLVMDEYGFYASNGFQSIYKKARSLGISGSFINQKMSDLFSDYYLKPFEVKRLRSLIKRLEARSVISTRQRAKLTHYLYRALKTSGPYCFQHLTLILAGVSLIVRPSHDFIDSLSGFLEAIDRADLAEIEEEGISELEAYEELLLIVDQYYRSDEPAMNQQSTAREMSL